MKSNQNLDMWSGECNECAKETRRVKMGRYFIKRPEQRRIR